MRRRYRPRSLRSVEHPGETVRIVCSACRQTTRLPITQAAFRAMPTCCGRPMLFVGQQLGQAPPPF